MPLSPLLEAVAQGIARDTRQKVFFVNALIGAAENGPWRYSPEEVAEMWSELTSLNKSLDLRVSVMSGQYHPWVVWSVLDRASAINSEELS